MNLNINELELKIDRMKKNLISIALETGINSDATLFYSQKIDELITTYQKLKLKMVETE